VGKKEETGQCLKSAFFDMNINETGEDLLFSATAIPPPLNIDDFMWFLGHFS